jgi:hypothetical protein
VIEPSVPERRLGVRGRMALVRPSPPIMMRG